jgi:hypothetical protein
MENLFNCITITLIRYIQKNLSSLSLWDDTSSDSRIKVQIASKICKEWCDIPIRLITKCWYNHDHKWKGECYSNNFVISFGKRLENILYIRGLADEVSQLLSPKEIAQYDIDKIFNSVKETKPVFYSSSTDSDWNDIAKQVTIIIMMIVITIITIIIITIIITSMRMR